MRVLVCGSRDWTDPEPIRRELRALPIREGTFTNQDGYETYVIGPEIVHGAARGADCIAGQIAKEMGLPVRALPAQWEKYGKRAGPLRNEQMLGEFYPIDLVIAFHEDLTKSKGTKDMVNRALRDGIPVKIIPR